MDRIHSAMKMKTVREQVVLPAPSEPVLEHNTRERRPRTSHVWKSIRSTASKLPDMPDTHELFDDGQVPRSVKQHLRAVERRGMVLPAATRREVVEDEHKGFDLEEESDVSMRWVRAADGSLTQRPVRRRHTKRASPVAAGPVVQSVEERRLFRKASIMPVVPRIEREVGAADQAMKEREEKARHIRLQRERRRKRL